MWNPAHLVFSSYFFLVDSLQKLFCWVKYGMLRGKITRRRREKALDLLENYLKWHSNSLGAALNSHKVCIICWILSSQGPYISDGQKHFLAKNKIAFFQKRIIEKKIKIFNKELAFWSSSKASASNYLAISFYNYFFKRIFPKCKLVLKSEPPNSFQFHSLFILFVQFQKRIIFILFLRQNSCN